MDGFEFDWSNDCQTNGLVHCWYWKYLSVYFGVYDDGAEKSFLLVLHNISPKKEREKLLRLGEKYNQDSIIYVQPTIQLLIYTTGRYVEGKGYQKLSVNTTDNYSRLELTLYPPITVSQ